MRSLIAYAIMALKNWTAAGSMGGAQMITSPHRFLDCIFAEIMRGFTATGFRTVRDTRAVSPTCWGPPSSRRDRILETDLTSAIGLSTTV
jgi:hypothetical protein